ncbi:MAG TPA: SPOR domain-containing protein [Granulicella sp.]|nr:SPOR domain-containing protein [Granulicella sp.]
MNTLGNRDRDLDDYNYDRHDQNEDREISLGTGTILGIFFALAVVCAIFFGFGYAMGRKSAAPAPAAASTTSDSAAPTLAKPSSGSPFQTTPQTQPAATAPDTDTADAPAASDPSTDTASRTAATPAPIRQEQQAAIKAAVQNAQHATAEPVALRSGAKSAPAAAPGPAEPPMPQISNSGTAMVQIAAVSHQEDANLLLAALKKRGYPVFVRQEPTDQLLHIQVGPFATRKDAEAMRQRLQIDGYNAILK